MQQITRKISVQKPYVGTYSLSLCALSALGFCLAIVIIIIFQHYIYRLYMYHMYMETNDYKVLYIQIYEIYTTQINILQMDMTFTLVIILT